MDVLTVKEVADRLKCGLTTVYDMLAAGQLRGFRLGAGKGGVRVLAKSLEELIAGPVEPSPAQPSRPRRKQGSSLTPIAFTHLSR